METIWCVVHDRLSNIFLLTLDIRFVLTLSTQACAAGGTGFSVAPYSQLYLVKHVNAAYVTDNAGNRYLQTVRTSPDAYHDALFHIVDFVKKNNLQGKAVVSHSWGKYMNISKDPRRLFIVNSVPQSITIYVGSMIRICGVT